MKRVWVYEHLSAGGAPDAGGSLAAEGRAMRDALAADLARVGDCAVSVAVAAAGDTVPAGTFAAAPRPGETCFEHVARQAAQHDAVWIVAPETGQLLGRLQRIVGDERWIGCDHAAIMVASGKQATLRRLAGRGLCTPLAFQQPGDALRWVVKPEDGAGAVDTRLHWRLEDARADRAQRLQQGRPSSLEPWVDGEPLSLSLLCGATHTELLSVNRQRVALDDDGRLAFEGVDVLAIASSDPRHAALAELGRQVGRSIPGLRGYVGVDLVWHPRRGPVVIEINPRLTSAYVGLSARLGRNLASEVLARHDLEPVHACA